MRHVHISNSLAPDHVMGRGFARSVSVVVVCAAALLPASNAQAVIVAAPHSQVLGKEIGEWSVDWWNWVNSIPAAKAPPADTTGGSAFLNNDGPVFFLAGTFGGPQTRGIDLPTDRPILVPLINGIWYATPVVSPEIDTDLDTVDDDTEELFLGAKVSPDGPREFMERHIVDPIDQLNFSFDGLSAQELGIDLFDFRESAHGVAHVPAGSNAAQNGIPEGNFPLSYSTGYYVMLTDIGPGPHTLSFGGSRPAHFDVDGDGTLDLFPFSTQVHVVPEPFTAVLLAVGTVCVLAKRRRRM